MEKQQNVVFFIGAGFSAPFNLPVMSNFISKAKDLYAIDGKRHEVIGKTIKLISKYSFAKNYMKINLHNIEDLLSIFYMESIVEKRDSMLRTIESFIKDVIESYSISDITGIASFCNYLLNIKLKRGSRFIRSHNANGRVVEQPEYLYDGKRDQLANYGIISLNYDLLIEKAIVLAKETYSIFYKSMNQGNPIEKYYSIKKDINESGLLMAKLHGSINGRIIPPTWSKTIEKEIKKDWELAFQLLENATHIIFMGYSMPSTDNYIKYLLSSSLNNNQRLKSIYAISIDADGQTKKRYSEMFDFNFSYHNLDVIKVFRLFESIEEEIDFDFFDKYLESIL